VKSKGYYQKKKRRGKRKKTGKSIIYQAATEPSH
jgi:hypothetical protein